MFKLLIGLPLLAVAGALALAFALPLLALLPVVLAAGAGLFAVVFAVGIVGLIFRVLAGLLVGTGAVLLAVLGFGFLFAGVAVVVALGFALAHLLLPALVIVFVIWLARRAARPSPPPALPAPQT